MTHHGTCIDYSAREKVERAVFERRRFRSGRNFGSGSKRPDFVDRALVRLFEESPVFALFKAVDKIRCAWRRKVFLVCGRNIVAN